MIKCLILWIKSSTRQIKKKPLWLLPSVLKKKRRKKIYQMAKPNIIICPFANVLQWNDTISHLKNPPQTTIHVYILLSYARIQPHTEGSITAIPEQRRFLHCEWNCAIKWTMLSLRCKFSLFWLWLPLTCSYSTKQNVDDCMQIKEIARNLLRKCTD